MAPASSAPAGHAFARSRFVSWFLVPFLVYCAFAALVYVWHGPEPALNIDHLSYMKLGDEIRALYPGDYFRTFNQVRAYGVLLAFAYDYTGSHIVSFKIALALLTVAYLFSFQVFMTLVTRSPARAMLFSVLSALFVSFGASIWGMTDFSASLNRTIVIPLVVLVVWFFFRYFGSGWRYAIYPVLMCMSLLHLSAMHVILVFAGFELLDFAIRRRFRPTWDLARFAVAFAISIGIQATIEKTGVGATSYVGTLISMAVPPAKQIIAEKPVAPPPQVATATVEAPPGNADARKAAPARTEREPRGTRAETPPAEERPPRDPAKPLVEPAPPAPKDGMPAPKMKHEEAWRVELVAFPWRNMPLPLTTVATIALSFGLIFVLAVTGAVYAFRSAPPRPLDRQLAMFALAVPMVAFGLQTLLWATRGWLAVLPINFEEMRAINMIMFPAIYFVYRLYELAPPLGRLGPQAVRAGIVVLYVLQPITLLRALPADAREAIIETATEIGAIKRSDSVRMLFARQYLGLEDSRRFYYSTQPLVAWLSREMGPDDLVLSHLNELHMAGLKSTGSFLTVLDYQIWDPRRGHWAKVLEAVHRAVDRRDVDELMEIARTLKATYVVTDWPVEGAVYEDKYFYVVKVK